MFLIRIKIGLRLADELRFRFGLKKLGSDRAQYIRPVDNFGSAPGQHSSDFLLHSFDFFYHQFLLNFVG